MIFKLSILSLILTAALAAHAADGEYDGIPLEPLAGMQYEICQLNSGKTLEDVDRQTNLAAAAFESVGLDLGIITFTPLYDHADINNKTADYITMVYGTIPAFGEGWDKWEKSEEAAEVMRGRAEVGTCHFKFNHIDYRFMDVPALDATDRRVVQTEWCSRRPGISKAELDSQHRSWLEGAGNRTDFIGWAIIHPRLGQANAPGEFFHFFIYDSIGSLMADEEWIANGGGMEGVEDYYTNFVECNGPSVWSGSLAQTP